MPGLQGASGPMAERRGLLHLPCSATTVALAVACVLASAFGPGAADAQVRMRNSEAGLLRESAALESRGDYDGAEAVLLRLLEVNPASSGGLFALERVLRAKGEVATILPVVETFLEAQPRSSGVRSLGLRVLLEVDSLDALRRESEAWLEADPGQEVPYREIARVWERAWGGEEALALLRRGRSALDDEDALSLEIGDLLANAGDGEEAAGEWARAVERDPAQTATVTRRILALETEEEVLAAGRRVVSRLAESDDIDARRAGARLALDLELEDLAMELARAVAAELDDRARVTFLTDVARRARDREMVEAAAWAYDELGGEARSPAERRQFDLRIVEVSLASGDTLAALEAQRRVVESFSPGSVDRRRATAEVIRLESGGSDPDELRRMVTAFREEFPNAPELDALAASVASSLLARGDADGAVGVLEGVDGPRSSLERAYLLLADGFVAEGRTAMLLALTGLPPAEATPVIEFAGLLGRSSPEGAEALASAGVAAHAGQAGEAALGLAAAVEAFPEEERPALLAAAARLAADGGEDAVAAEIRDRLVSGHPEAPEAAPAALSLARWLARTPRGEEEAIRLLEDLIANRPNAAVVPDARVELEKLRARGR